MNQSHGEWKIPRRRQQWRILVNRRKPEPGFCGDERLLKSRRLR